MAQDHYFSENPANEPRPREISFDVDGKTFQLLSASGTFSATKLDPGTAVLLGKSAEFPDTGNVLDLGCGWGPIAISIAKLRPATRVWALDVNSRSLDLATQNARQLGLENVYAVRAGEISSDLQFDAIWSNPPIRIGKAALHDLLREWLPRLAVGGRAMLVVAKQLGADSLLSWLQVEFPELEATRYSTDKGFRVLQVIRR